MRFFSYFGIQNILLEPHGGHLDTLDTAVMLTRKTPQGKNRAGFKEYDQCWASAQRKTAFL